MPHRRSPASRQRRAARRYIINHAYHDRTQAESVARTPRKEVLTFLQSLFEGVDLSALNIEQGEVLADSRGRGSMQQMK